MADECTDVTTVEELSVLSVEDGLPVEHFLEVVHLQQADAESIHTALLSVEKKKDLQMGRIVVMDLMEQPHSQVKKNLVFRLE